MKLSTALNTPAAASLNASEATMNTSSIPADQKVTCGCMSNPALTMFLSPGFRWDTSG